MSVRASMSVGASLLANAFALDFWPKAFAPAVGASLLANAVVPGQGHSRLKALPQQVRMPLCHYGNQIASQNG